MFQCMPLGYIAANIFHLSNRMYGICLDNFFYSQFYPWLLRVCNPVKLKGIKKIMFTKRAKISGYNYTTRIE